MDIGKIANRVRNNFQRLRNQSFSGALILMYHRIAEADSDPWSLCVTPKHFAEHLDVLRNYGKPLQLKELTKRLSNHQSIHRSIVITFDDGYADNFYYAKPLLKQYGIPATVFVTTGGLNQNQEYWWDELDRLLLQPGKLPPSLRLNVDGKKHHWELGEAAQYNPSEFQRDRYWRMEGGNDPTPRHLLYRSLYSLLQYLPLDERNQLLNDLRLWANAEPSGRSTHRPLSSQELVDLGAEGLVEIGAHTVNHPFLAKLSLAAQRSEIQQSKDTLEKTLGYPVTSFSYPNGSYVPETTSIVQEVGFDSACCSISSRVQQDSHPFLLPRIVVEDWDGKTFSHWLSHCFQV